MIPPDSYSSNEEEIDRLRDLILQFADAVKFTGQLALRCPETGSVQDFWSEINAPMLSTHVTGCEKCQRVVSAVKELMDEV